MKVNDMMRLNRLVNGMCLFTCLTLAGCGAEKGFEYATDARLAPMRNSGVIGTVKVGHGIGDYSFRMRVALHGLQSNRRYQLRFFDATHCTENALASAMQSPIAPAERRNHGASALSRLA